MVGSKNWWSTTRLWRFSAWSGLLLLLFSGILMAPLAQHCLTEPAQYQLSGGTEDIIYVTTKRRSRVLLVGFICSIAAVDVVEGDGALSCSLMTTFSNLKAISSSAPVQAWQSSGCSAPWYSQWSELNSVPVLIWKCMPQCLALGLYPHAFHCFTLPLLSVLEFQLISPCLLFNKTKQNQ